MFQPPDKFLRIDELNKHIFLVQDGCRSFAKKYEDNDWLSLKLIANGQIHDQSKFLGIEWKYLNEKTASENPDLFAVALNQHISTNPHHPEYWMSIKDMPDHYVLEMIADWHARSEEFETDLKEWFESVAISKYDIKGNQLKFIQSNVNYIYNCLEGKRFGLLTAISRVEGSSKGQWNCLCDCGNETLAYRYDLRNGKKQSCGCIKVLHGQNSASWKGFGEISGKSWGGIKKSAERRGIEFSISVDYAWSLFEEQMSRCAISGVKLEFPKNSNGKSMSSLDRIDSSFGYVEGNVQWVHPIVNYMKHTLSQEDFISWCGKIFEYNNGNNKVPQTPEEYDKKDSET